MIKSNSFFLLSFIYLFFIICTTETGIDSWDAFHPANQNLVFRCVCVCPNKFDSLVLFAVRK